MKYKIKLRLPDYKDLLRYGEIISNNEYCDDDDFHRILRIRYIGIMYHLHMRNGEVESLIQWDNLPYNEDEMDLQGMDDTDVIRLMMFADRDREKNMNAERVYWLCVREINRREEDSYMED